MTEQIDIVNIARRVFRKWFFILLIGLTCALLSSVVASRIYQPSYSSQALITVYGKSVYGSVVNDAQDTADVFKEIITSNLLQKKVAQAMDIPSLPGTISCSNIPYTNMITISVSADTPQDVMTVINGVLTHHGVVTEHLLNDMVLQVLEEPVVPTTPVKNFNEKEVLFKGFIAGVVASAGLLFLIFYFRDDIKNEKQVEKKLDTGLFAVVFHENIRKGFTLLPGRSRKRRKGILVSNQTTSFGYIETFQKMCMKLQYKTSESMQKSILLTSVKENEGKSTVSVNLAITLAKMGKRVILVDMDLRRPSIYKLLELKYTKDQKQIGDVLSGSAKWHEVLKKVPDMELYALAGNRSYRDSSRLLSQKNVDHLFATLRANVDYVIIDTPPIDAVSDTEEILRFADAGLLVVRQDCAVAQDINDTIDIFNSTKCKLLGCVYNNVETEFLGSRVLRRDYYYNNYRYSKSYGHRYGK